MLKTTCGREGTSEQSTAYWPNTMGVAPSARLSASTSAVGPAMSDVPVSAMAWQPCNRQRVLLGLGNADARASLAARHTHVGAEHVSFHGHLVHGELPVGGFAERHVREVPAVMSGVRPAQDDLAALRRRRISAHTVQMFTRLPFYLLDEILMYTHLLR